MAECPARCFYDCFAYHPGLLAFVVEGKIVLTPAVELSYFTDTEQTDLLKTMESEDSTPSLSQAQQLKQLSQAGRLNMDRIFAIMRAQEMMEHNVGVFFQNDNIFI